MANDFQSQPHCLKCGDKGYINYYPSFASGEVEICGCRGLDVLESESIARLKGTNKIKNLEYNEDLQVLNKIKLHKL